MVLSVNEHDVDLGMLAVGLLDEELRLLVVRLEGGLLRLGDQLIGLGEIVLAGGGESLEGEAAGGAGALATSSGWGMATLLPNDVAAASSRLKTSSVKDASTPRADAASHSTFRTSSLVEQSRCVKKRSRSK